MWNDAIGWATLDGSISVTLRLDASSPPPTAPCRARRMKYAVWILIALLVVLHQDVWFWDDAQLLFGFLPVGLAYHMGLSLAAAAVWWFATLVAWPIEEPEPGRAAASEAVRREAGR